MAGVLLEPTSVAGVPGGTATCSVKIRNTGAVVDAFTVSVLGDAAAWATVIPAQLSLFPGSDGTVEIQFAVPRSSNPPAGPIDFGVRVAASEDADGSVVEEGVLELAPFTEFNAKLTPRTSEGKRSAKHEVMIDNRGNAPIDVAVGASDPDELLAFEVKPPTLTIGPGETGHASVKVIAAKGFAKGADKHRPFEVFVTGGPTDPPVRLDGNMVQKPGMPRFILPLVGLAVAAAVLILVLPALLSKKDDSGTLRLANEQAPTTVPADDEAAAAAQAVKDQAEAEAAAEAEKAANGKDPGSVTGGAPAAAVVGAGAATAAASGGATGGGTASAGSGTATGGGTTESTTPNAAPPPPPPGATTTSTSTTVPSTNSQVRGTWMYDYDNGTEGTGSNCDIFWQQQTSVERYFTPVNGAQVANMGPANYEAVTKAQLQALTYSTVKINGSDSGNQMPPGTVIAIKTNSGRFAKVKVIAKNADNTLTFRFYTYP